TLRVRIIVPVSDMRRAAPATTVWGNEFRNAGETPCRFSVVGQEMYLTLEMTSPDAFQNPDFLANVRAEMFRSILHDGQENLQFPAWLQTGLCAVFAGVPDTTGIEGRNPTHISRLPAMPEAETVMNPEYCTSSVFWVRYFLTADDGKHFFPFWEELHRYTQTPLASNAQYNVRARTDAQLQITQFLQDKSHDSAQEMRDSLIFWRHINNPRSLSTQEMVSIPQNYVRVFWNPSVTVLNLPEMPTFTLEEEWRDAFLKMATILKITHKYIQYRTTENGNKYIYGNGSENRSGGGS
ncbi:MAG: hypothetical protein Q4C70_07690, partial [Planctomycetia bacterium]|nr:hypothetical protein [Planctomycetia bacterium]